MKLPPLCLALLPACSAGLPVPDVADATTGSDATTFPRDAAPAPEPDASCPLPIPAPPFLTPHGCVVAGGDSRVALQISFVERAVDRLAVVPFTNAAMSGIYAAQIDETRFAQVDRPAILACDAGSVLYVLEVGVNDYWHGLAEAGTTAGHVRGIVAQAHDAGARVLLVLDPASRVVPEDVNAVYRGLESEAGADLLAAPCDEQWSAVVYDSGADASALPWTVDKIHGLPVFEVCAGEALFPVLVDALSH